MHWSVSKDYEETTLDAVLKLMMVLSWELRGQECQRSAGVAVVGGRAISLTEITTQPCGLMNKPASKFRDQYINFN